MASNYGVDFMHRCISAQTAAVELQRTANMKNIFFYKNFCSTKKLHIFFFYKKTTKHAVINAKWERHEKPRGVPQIPTHFSRRRPRPAGVMYVMVHRGICAREIPERHMEAITDAQQPADGPDPGQAREKSARTTRGGSGICLFTLNVPTETL